MIPKRPGNLLQGDHLPRAAINDIILHFYLLVFYKSEHDLWVHAYDTWVLFGWMSSRDLDSKKIIGLLQKHVAERTHSGELEFIMTSYGRESAHEDMRIIYEQLELFFYQRTRSRNDRRVSRLREQTFARICTANHAGRRPSLAFHDFSCSTQIQIFKTNANH